MKKHYDEKGDLTAIETDAHKPVDIPAVKLRYISPCPDVRFVADLCIKEDEIYFVRYSLNRNQAVNMIDELTKLVRQFDKRTPEDTYNG